MKLDKVTSIKARRRVESLFENYMQSISVFVEHNRLAHWKAKRIEIMGRYWNDSQYTAYEIVESDQVIGFALVNNYAKNKNAGRSLSQFYISQQFQSMGYGREAAQLLLDKEQEIVEVPVLRRNIKAVEFWANITARNPARHRVEYSGIDDSCVFVLNKQ